MRVFPVCDSQTCLLRKVCILFSVYTFLKFSLLLSIYGWLNIFSLVHTMNQAPTQRKEPGCSCTIRDVQLIVDGMRKTNLWRGWWTVCALNSMVVKDVLTSSPSHCWKPTSLIQLISALLLYRKRNAMIKENLNLNPRFVTESFWSSHNLWCVTFDDTMQCEVLGMPQEWDKGVQYPYKMLILVIKIWYCATNGW